ncbi:hypothetical protein CFN78_05545 [Amycolatopsis antarctica]|uniref:DUF4333 domain-containing protein n=1 Tax=Amycolatopsis antarctica TaxID=1854586 RepID=A0A263D7R0_9PSEU|nr:hypothetical protein [Amycolatopsis antarctica]OZM74574.1 hypothetical protein CFN78_05545 [Amycolatopsis antarctica]
MKLNKMVVAAGLVLLAGTACANPDTDSPQPAADQQPAPSSAPQEPGNKPAPGNEAQQPGEAPGEIPLAAEKIDGAALPESYPRTAATVERTNQVAIRAQEGGCGKASAEVAEQTAQRVVVKLVETTPRNKMACTMDIRYPTVKVDLAEPLGERQLVLEEEARQG